MRFLVIDGTFYVPADKISNMYIDEQTGRSVHLVFDNNVRSNYEDEGQLHLSIKLPTQKHASAVIYAIASAMAYSNSPCIDLRYLIANVRHYVDTCTPVDYDPLVHGMPSELYFFTSNEEVHT